MYSFVYQITANDYFLYINYYVLWFEFVSQYSWGWGLNVQGNNYWKKGIIGNIRFQNGSMLTQREWGLASYFADFSCKAVYSLLQKGQSLKSYFEGRDVKATLAGTLILGFSVWDGEKQISILYELIKLWYFTAL